jgi:cytochrome c oxidase assembly protein subunit 15
MKKIVLISIFLAMIVIVLAAYTRLSDAGLGCTDWPGCYSHTSFSKTTKNIEHAQQAISEPHFEMYKTWNEMIQRYFINRIFSKTYDKPVKSAFLLSFLVCIQVC